MQRNLIFIGGIHGVGKSTLCNTLSESYGIDHYSASNLIKKVSNIDFPKNKKIEGIDKNQDSLIQSIEFYISTEVTYLLDGHFCLLSKNGEITEIPLITFENLSPKAILVLKDEPYKVFSRIKNRDSNEMNVDFISNFQTRELEYASRITELLQIPLLVANPFKEIYKIKKFIKSNI